MVALIAKNNGLNPAWINRKKENARFFIRADRLNRCRYGQVSLTTG